MLLVSVEFLLLFLSMVKVSSPRCLMSLGISSSSTASLGTILTATSLILCIKIDHQILDENKPNLPSVYRVYEENQERSLHFFKNIRNCSPHIRCQVEKNGIEASMSTILTKLILNLTIVWIKTRYEGLSKSS